MGPIEKTVFISYRRTNSFMARAVYQSLTARGYDVFFDYEGINSGDFEQIILGNLRARAHFLVILTPSALERCNEPGDWLRREIEMALDEKRNIVPLFFEGFSFDSPSIGQYLTGKMARLKNYNGLNVPSDYFNEAMDKLVSRFLNTPLTAVLHPLSSHAKKGADAQKAALEKTETVTENELSAEEWFEKGYKDSDPDEKIHYYTEAIRLQPDYAAAFINRGLARNDTGDLEGAIRDYNKAIRLRPDYADAFYNRGLTHQAKGDLEAAIRDYNKAIRLQPDDALALNNRGLARQAKGDLKGAVRDYNKAIRLQPDYAFAFNNRGLARQAKGDLEGAIRDYNKAIRLQPDYAFAFNNRGLARQAKGDLEGAVRDDNEAIRLQPDYAFAFNNRGLARQAKGDLEGAVRDYSEAIRLQPDYAKAYNNRALARSANDDLQGALEDYNEAIRLQPDDTAAYYNRGLVHQFMRNLDEAANDYEEAIRLQPANGTARSSLVSVLRKLGRTAEAGQQEKLARELMARENEYSQACFEAICGNVGRALELLKIGLEKGQATREWARRDPDLENIRSDLRFEEFLGGE